MAGVIRRPPLCPKHGLKKQGKNMKGKIEQKESRKARKNKKIRKKTKKQKKDNTVGMHQQVDFPLSPSKSYPLLKRKNKVFFCWGINYSDLILSKPLISMTRSFSWEINCIERKRSSSLVSSLLLRTKFDLFYIFFLTNSYCYLLSRPKPGTRICDHDRHANIKPKPNINKNQLTFNKTFTKSFLFLFILVSLLK